MRFFNTAGPVKLTKHYCLAPLQRLNVDHLLLLIQQEKYFVLHAPRQTGKTSSLLALRDYLNAEGNYRCVYFNVEGTQAAREDVAAAMQAILGNLGSAVRIALNDEFIDDIWFDILAKQGPYNVLQETLSR